MKKIVFFDFDGTLYPFRPYDSEDLLFCLAAETPQEKILAEQTRLADEKGFLSFDEVRTQELKLITGKDISYIDKDAQYIFEKAGKGFLTPLRKLKNAGFDLYVVSCGLSDIAERYLKLQEVRELFSGIFSKDLIISDNKIMGIDCSQINWSEDKKTVVQKILSSYKESTFSVAVGDGFTDIPMFTATDKAVFVDYGENPFTCVSSILDCGYPITKSIEEMVNYILSLG